MIFPLFAARLFQAETGHHFYTSSSIEASSAVAAGYVEEGVPFSNEQVHSGVVDVFRFFHPQTGDHFYTTNVAERDLLSTNAAYNYEGVGFSALAESTPGADAIYRFYSADLGNHLYTANMTEGLLAGYAYEGVAWYSAAF